MPTATLTFRLPDERSEHDCANNGWKWSSVVHQLDAWLRGQIHYAKKPSPRTRALSEARSQLREIAAGYGLDVDEG